MLVASQNRAERGCVSENTDGACMACAAYSFSLAAMIVLIENLSVEINAIFGSVLGGVFGGERIDNEVSIFCCAIVPLEGIKI